MSMNTHRAPIVALVIVIAIHLADHRTVTDSVLRREAATRLVQRRRGRSVGRVALSASIGSHGPQRYGGRESATGRAGGSGHPEERRQRHRCRRGHFRGVESGRADERRTWRRPVRHRLHREGEQAVHLECQRKGAERADAGAYERAWLLVESGELGPGLRDAACRYSVGNGARLRLGLGRGAAPVRHDDVQGDAAVRNRLRRQRVPGVGTDRQRLAPSARAAANAERPTQVLQPDRSGFRRDLVHQWATAAGRPAVSQSRHGQDISHPAGQGA